MAENGLCPHCNHAVFSILNSAIRIPHSKIRTGDGQLFMDDSIVFQLTIEDV